MSSLDDIPKPLTKLIRLIMRGFYNIEQKIVIDMLVRRRETKEDDLVEVLKLERKHLRSLIAQMKQDKFINQRPLMETDNEGKSTRTNYYSINYRRFVNVVKYKIDHMRRKLETEERDLTSRASFSCKSCGKKFTDLELGLLINANTNELNCSVCDGIVEEDPNERPAADTRLIMARFNEQMQPIYTLLQETEAIKWSINEVDRNNFTAKNQANSSNSSNGGVPGANTSTTTNGNLSGDQQNQDLNSGTNNQVHYPITIDGFDRYKKLNKSQFSDISPEVEALLLREENNVNSSTIAHDSSHDEDEPMLPMIMVTAGKIKIPIDQVSEDHIVLMSPQQRQEYERIMQQVYSLIFD